ncbi:hypothetical protein J31TS4_24120 [Paenibacillus sp. J31TS4]|uniref:glycosyltransferase family 61 protein n=1 Tax=Paenibacillus sp. J31TS4 TaxID=2807195 RepID=UPI001B109D51|nr:glycosyltransferase family 61 protein [Paenibacillus sp. J31TS4]GIP39132.1 hypothetical protein J31TS4_24120 [Paenibacillus sp. J31TS4]
MPHDKNKEKQEDSRKSERRKRRERKHGRKERRNKSREFCPRESVLSTQEWVRSKQSGDPPSKYLQVIHPEEEAVYSEAKGLDSPVHGHFQQRSAYSPEAFVAVVKHGRVWGKNGVVITPDHKLLADVSWEFTWDYIMNRRHSVFHKWEGHSLTKTDQTLGVLSYFSSGNYFHWMLDVLPRLGLLSYSGRAIDGYIICGDGAPAFQNETLSLMGVPLNQVIYTHNRFHLQARRLVVPSLTSRFTWTDNHYPLPIAYAKWAVEFLRQAFLENRAPSKRGNKRLYISRAHAAQRRLINEEEIVRLLASYGFTTITPEYMTVDEQIRLFANAEAIVAPHGAALANLAFCMPGTKVFELFAPSYTPGYYWMLSSHNALDYYYLIGKDRPQAVVSWAGASDFHMDPGLLSRLLTAAKLS